MLHPSLNVRAIRQQHDSAQHDSQAEEEFRVALERYRKANKRAFPQASEVLAVAVALGYHKVPLEVATVATPTGPAAVLEPRPDKAAAPQCPGRRKALAAVRCRLCGRALGEEQQQTQPT